MARLPTPGADAGNWGEILNEYLSVEHAADGTLKPEGSLATKASASTVTTLTSRIGTSIAGDGSLTTAATNQAVAAAQSSGAFASSAQGSLASSAVQPSELADVATSGNYDDLTNRPSIPAAQVPADWNASSGPAQILNKPTLFDGDYDSLSNRPTLGTAAAASTSDFASSSHNHDGEYATTAQGALADSALQPAAIANFETSTQLNDRDSANRDRANHTGTQAISTVTGLEDELDSKAPAVAAKGVVAHGADGDAVRPAGYASIEWIGSVEPLAMIDGDTWVVMPA